MLDTWLTGNQDYYEGLQILRDHDCSDFLIELLLSGPDVYNTPRLLQEILNIQSQKLDVPIQPAIEAQISADPATPMYISNPHLEKKIRIKEQIRQLYKEIGHLKPQLALLPQGTALYECARLIITKDLRKQDLWEHLHYFEANGQWFDSLPENQLKPFELEKAIKNAMSNRSKAANYLKTPLPAAKVLYYQQKVNSWTEKIGALIKQRT